MALSAQQVAAKWASNLAASTISMTAGVDAVTVNPAQSAIAAIPQYQAGVLAAVASGKVAAGLGRVTLEGWKQAMKTKGIPRVAQGAQAAVPKVQAFMSKLLPYQQGLQTLLSQTPRGDLQTNIQRMVTTANYMSKFSNQ